MSERARQVLKHIDMIEHLRDAMERPEPKLPMDWLFNWLETSNPWLISIGFVLALASYIMSFVVSNPIWLIMAIGLWAWSWSGMTRRIKARSAAERAEFKAHMDELERVMWAQHRFYTFEAMITPEWML